MPETKEQWAGEDGSQISVYLSRDECGAHEPAVCGIMHEPASSVVVDDLPNAWRRGNNTARLECGHVFNAHALATHFLLTHMRCPMCRTGVDDRLAVSSVPRCFQKKYAQKRENAKPDDDDLTEALEAAQFEDDHLDMLTVTALFRTANRHIVEGLISPLSREVVDLTGEMNEFRVQRSWKRQLVATFYRFNASDAQSEVVFSIKHPMLVEPVESQPMSVHEIHAFCERCQNNNQPASCEIPILCPAVAGSQVLAAVDFNPIERRASLRVDAMTVHQICIQSLIQQLQSGVQNIIDFSIAVA